MKPMVGVLQLQGDFQLHSRVLKKVGADVMGVRWPEDLQKCGALIIPGGESTVIMKLMRQNALFKAIGDFSENFPVMGTCAGMIALARKVKDSHLTTLGLIDIEVERNGYGRQKNSFFAEVQVEANNKKSMVRGYFIRAPRIVCIGQGVEPMGQLNGELVMVRSKRILALSFHPEVSGDPRVHDYFVSQMMN